MVFVCLFVCMFVCCCLFVVVVVCLLFVYLFFIRFLCYRFLWINDIILVEYVLNIIEIMLIFLMYVLIRDALTNI